MAWFGKDPAQAADRLLKRIEGGEFKSKQEKMELLRQAEELDLKIDVLVRLLGGRDVDVARWAVSRVPSCSDPRKLDVLVRALGGGQVNRRFLTSAILALRSPDLPRKLRDLMRAKRTEVRRAGLDLLAAMPDWAEHIGLLKAALKDPDRDLRVLAVGLLGRAPRDPNIFLILRELILAPEDPVRHKAIEALAAQPDMEIVDDFVERLPHEPPRVQDQILRGLGLLMGERGNARDRVLGRILPLLAAEDQQIREAAARLLSNVEDQLYVLRRFLVFAKGIAFWLRDRSFTTIAKTCRNLVAAISELLQDEDVDVAVGAMVMAQKTGDPAYVPGLVQLLERDVDWWVRVPALETLAGFRTEQVDEVLIEALNDPTLEQAALSCMAERSFDKFLPHVLRRLDAPVLGVRKAALRALCGFRGDQVLTSLERLARENAGADLGIMALEQLDQRGREGQAIAEAVREANKKATPEDERPVELEMLSPHLRDG